MYDGDPHIPSASHPAPGVRLDEPAPLFEARSTHGVLRLADYRGSWVMLFAHPADFTPVCTSEFVALAERQAEFDALGCTLIGLSVDSVYAHLAWIERIGQDFGVMPRFPIVEDPSLSIAKAYGMIHPGAGSTATVRSVFVIDPAGVVRALVHYPMAVGRSVDELLRLVQALEATAEGEDKAPEGWRPGDSLLAPAPETQAALSNHSGSAPWYARRAT